MEVTLMAGRSGGVLDLCQRIATTFADASLPREAKKALAYLTEQQSVTEADIEQIRTFLERLEKMPDETFRI